MRKKWPQVDHFEIDQVEIVHGIATLETAHCSIVGLMVYLSGPVFQILRIKKLWPIIDHFGRHDLVSVRILPNFELIRAISKMDIRYKF